MTTRHPSLPSSVLDEIAAVPDTWTDPLTPPANRIEWAIALGLPKSASKKSVLDAIAVRNGIFLGKSGAVRTVPARVAALREAVNSDALTQPADVLVLSALVDALDFVVAGWSSRRDHLSARPPAVHQFRIGRPFVIPAPTPPVR